MFVYTLIYYITRTMAILSQLQYINIMRNDTLKMMNEIALDAS